LKTESKLPTFINTLKSRLFFFRVIWSEVFIFF